MAIPPPPSYETNLAPDWARQHLGLNQGKTPPSRRDQLLYIIREGMPAPVMVALRDLIQDEVNVACTKICDPATVDEETQRLRGRIEAYHDLVRRLKLGDRMTINVDMPTSVQVRRGISE